jgi:MFS transporter, DHA1 family, chloramphenicol resistance protein
VRENTAKTSPTSYLSLYATLFMVGVVVITLGPVLDPLTRDLGIPLQQAGLISVAFAVGMLVGVIALNFLFARVPVKWALIGAAWLQTVALVATAMLAAGLWSMLITYFFVGLGCVFLNSLPGMWVSSNVKAGTHRTMVVVLLFFAIGMAVAPIFIGIALGLGATWRWVFAVEAVFSAALAIFVTSRPLTDIEGRKNLTWARLRGVVSFNPALFWAVVFASVLYIGGEFILNVWLPKFEIDVFGVSKTTASIAVGLFWFGLIIGRLAVVALTKRYPASRLLMVGLGIMAVFALGVAVANSVPLSMVMAFFSGLGASAAFPLIMGFAGKFPAWHAGVVVSAVVLAGAVGRIVFPYLIGPLAHSAGFRWAMGLAFLLAAAGALLAFFLHGISGEGSAGEPVAEHAAALSAASGEG